jgi:hypothetical protein
MFRGYRDTHNIAFGAAGRRAVILCEGGKSLRHNKAAQISDFIFGWWFERGFGAAANVSAGGTKPADGFVGWPGVPRTFGVEASYKF